MRYLLRKLFLLIGLSLPFILVAVLVLEVGMRLMPSTGIPLRRPLCGRYDPELLMVFRPNCHSVEMFPYGDYVLDTNEDGLRDRPRSFFQKGAIFVLGDSHVQGYGLPVEKGLSRVLEKHLAPLKTPLLNVGRQAYGVTQQALLARRVMPHYSIKGLLWFINPTDMAEDIFFQLAQNAGFRVKPQSFWLSDFNDRWFAGKSLFLTKAAEVVHMQWPYFKAMRGRVYDPAVHCSTMKNLVKELKEKKIPVVFIAMGFGLKSQKLSYRGIVPDENDYQKLLQCVKDSGAELISMREEFADTKELFFPYDWHFNETGIEIFSQSLSKKILPLWPKK